MELVLTLLAVVLLVVLPVAFLLLMTGGLFYSVFRVIRGDKKEAESPTASSIVVPSETPGAESPAGKVVTPNGNKVV